MDAVTFMFLPEMFENLLVSPANMMFSFLLHLYVVQLSTFSHTKEAFVFPV